MASTATVFYLLLCSVAWDGDYYNRKPAVREKPAAAVSENVANAALPRYNKRLLIAGVVLITVLCVTAIGTSAGAIAITANQRSQVQGIIQTVLGIDLIIKLLISLGFGSSQLCKVIHKGCKTTIIMPIYLSLTSTYII